MQGRRWQGGGRPVAPMSAASGDAPIVDQHWVYEPKYEGRRALVAVEPGVGRDGLHIWSARGGDETARYLDIVRALATLARRLKAAVVLDGVIIAADAGRSAFVAFDVLRDGDDDLRPLPLTTRRAHLENILANVGAGSTVRLGEFVPGDGRALARKAAMAGRDAIVAKRLDAPYRSGRQSNDWREITVRREHAVLPRRSATRRRVATRLARGLPAPLAGVIEQLASIEASGGAGTLQLPSGDRLEVSRLDKIYWPEPSVTKGDLMRYYVGVSPLLLPVVADRPLVMRRFPNGISGRAFYQQHAPADAPAGVRVLTLPGDRVVPSRLIGGSLLTLLSMVQIGAIAQDPWFSRVQTLDTPDHAVIDLDPMPGVTFGRVLDVARWVRDELARSGIPSMPKTSGVSGLHVYIPLRRHTPYAAARIFCQLVATTVAERHPDMATIERSVNARGRRVYVDYLQNSRGKTLAAAYSARASGDAGVSTPLTWAEVDAGVDRGDFTIRTIPARVAAVGDLWAALRASPGADLGAIVERAQRKPA
jgi:bifunctional non-homologous end joining protein LigD